MSNLKNVNVNVNRVTWKKFRIVAMLNDMKAYELLEIALNDAIAKHSPIKKE